MANNTWKCARQGSSYLNADSEQQARLGEEGKGLVVGDILTVVPHCVVHGCVGDEEEHHGAVAAVEGTFEEGLLVEVQVELPGDVELRMLETPHVIHILTSRGRERNDISPDELNSVYCLVMFWHIHRWIHASYTKELPDQTDPFPVQVVPCTLGCKVLWTTHHTPSEKKSHKTA